MRGLHAPPRPRRLPALTPLAQWTPATVAVAVAKRDGTRAKRDRRVEADILDGGLFAVHATLATLDGERIPTWTVTHAPSGYYVVQYARDEAAARLAAGQLARVPVDWGALTPETSAATFRSLPLRTQARIKAIVRRAK